MYQVNDLQFESYALRLASTMSDCIFYQELLAIEPSVTYLQHQATTELRMETYEYVQFKYNYLLDKFKEK
jgi:hypothetical protein